MKKHLSLATAAGAVVVALALAACSGQTEAQLIASAKAFLAKNEPNAAVIQLKNGLQKNPASPELRFLLGSALLKTGDPVNATVELRKAQELKHPDDQLVPELASAWLAQGDARKVLTQFATTALSDPDAAARLHTALATAHAMEGDAAAARTATAAALRARPAHTPAVVLQARLQLGDGDVDGALASLDRVLAAEPAHEAAGLLKGDVLWRAKKDPGAALAAFDTVRAALPQSIASHSAAIGLLFEQQRFDDARPRLTALERVAPQHPETLFVKAQFAFLDKDYKSARDLSERVLKAMPDNVRVLEIAGASEYRQGHLLQAEALLTRAVKAAPQRVLPRQMLAQSLMRSGQPTKAVEVLQPLIADAGADGTSLALAGEAYLRSNDLARSDAAFQRAARAAPENAGVLTSRALGQLARGGDTGAAIKDLEAIAAGDASPRADLALVSARARKGDIDGALKAVDRLAIKMPDRALPDLLRGRLLTLKRDSAGAVAAFERALSKEPNTFAAVSGLASLDLAANKPERAAERLEALRKADPKSWQAALALAELAQRAANRQADVLRLTTEAVQADGNEPAPRLALVQAHLRANDPKSALVAAQGAVAALPNNPDVLEALGRAQMAAGDGQQAVSTFSQLSAMQPQQPLHHVLLAGAHVQNKDAVAAGRSLRRALEVQPGLPAAERGLVALAVLDKRPQDGVALARDMQQRDPKAAAGFLLEGDVEASRGAWAPAVAAYAASLQRAPATETALKLHRAMLAADKRADADRLAAGWVRDHPKDAAFHYHLGDVALSRNELVAAEGHYRQVLALQPGNALALNNVAWLLVKQRKEGAVALAEEANRLLPDRAPLLDTLASALAAENQLPRAIETQKKAMARSPGDDMLRLNLARHLVQAGDKAQARAELETLRKLGDTFKGHGDVVALLKTV